MGRECQQQRIRGRCAIEPAAPSNSLATAPATTSYATAGTGHRRRRVYRTGTRWHASKAQPSAADICRAPQRPDGSPDFGHLALTSRHPRIHTIRPAWKGRSGISEAAQSRDLFNDLLMNSWVTRGRPVTYALTVNASCVIVLLPGHNYPLVSASI